MIKFLITHPETKRKIFGMVITDGNIELLKKDKPLHFNAEQLGLSEVKFNELLLLYYESNEIAVKDLKEKGYIDKDTVIEDIKPSVKH